MEWAECNKYNSFNSYKGLTYYEHYKKIVTWLDGNGELPPPIEASLDPISACNQNCYYCNSQRYLPAKMKWSREYIKDTLDYLADWGVKAFCWGGGGEALLNENIRGMTAYGISKGMECAIITNGALLGEDYINELLLCRWIGISLDASSPVLYKRIRGRDDFNTVVQNIKRLVDTKASRGKKCDISLKALVLPENVGDLVNCGMLAKVLGVDDFHVRPVDLERKDFAGSRADFNKANIESIFEGLHDLEDDDFHVYTVTHKYDEGFHIKHDFDKCLASPLVVQICTDKQKYVCVDHRMEERFQFDEWGSDKHRELLKGINPQKECARCTWSEYNRQISECVVEDRLCRSFP
ncbi:hypothetical protein CMI37_31795 [Candidatus Pacearchaeota archaeon]|nr:hypothetical protein [Candidatus Pacearchaeota archaeon]|tara:strand:+ start:961 stop:2016 length:1056 start_codon:yes stop_codon:yes gene_type:complete